MHADNSIMLTTDFAFILRKIHNHCINLPLNDGSADPQKKYADAVIEVLPTQLIPGDNEGKVLRVRLIMKEGLKYFKPVYLFDEGSTINWIPCGRKLTCSYPGIKFFYGPDSYFSNEVIRSRFEILFCFSSYSEQRWPT